MIDAAESVAKLLAIDKQLPDAIRKEILSLAPSTVPHLIRVLVDRALWAEGSPGNGWAAVHAVTLLAEIASPEAILPMLHTLRDTDPFDWLHDRLCYHLPKMGPVVFQPALDEYQRASDPEYVSDLCTILAGAGVKDDRVFRILIDQLQRQPDWAAGNLAEYGDPRALPHISRAFDRFELVDENPFANHAVIEYRCAIEKLGGTLSPMQVAKYRRFMAARDRGRPTDDLRSGEPHRTKPGRNDPCWCGSNKKYKRCHLESDKATRGSR